LARSSQATTAISAPPPPPTITTKENIVNQETICADLRLAASRALLDASRAEQGIQDMQARDHKHAEVIEHAISSGAELANIVVEMLDAGALILIPTTLDAGTIFGFHLGWLSAKLDNGAELELITGAGLGSSLLAATIRQGDTYIAQTVDTRHMAARWFTNLEDLAEQEGAQK
jgi:predicted metalloprotease with PDZ domain